MVLEAIWFYLWGLLWAVYFVTDGFDLGIGTLLPVLGKSENDRRLMINSIGPLWDGNEVWLLTAGGVTFAAFPKVYAVMFSSLYAPLMLILFALIFRGVSFEFRSKIADPRWRRIWDGCISVGSFLPALLLGVAFANIFKGLPLDRNGLFHGTILTLLNPYGVLGGLLFVGLFLQHGSIWLAFKTEGDLQRRAVGAAATLWIAVLAAAVIFLGASAAATPLYANFIARPVLFIEIAATVAALLAVRIFLARKAYFKAWAASAATIVGAVFFGIIGLYPAMLPSSLNPRFSLTAHNAASSPLTLKIMLTVVIVFVPVVLAYQAWSYNLFKTKITAKDLETEHAY
jgi:cytochrome d ubiquinol oxidase subunit II